MEVGMVAVIVGVAKEKDPEPVVRLQYLLELGNLSFQGILGGRFAGAVARFFAEQHAYFGGGKAECISQPGAPILYNAGKFFFVSIIARKPRDNQCSTGAGRQQRCGSQG